MLTWAQLLLKIINLINTILTFFKLQKAKQEGREEVVSKVNEATEKLKDEFKKIDNSNTSFDDAIGSLRENSSDADTNGGSTKANGSGN